MNNLPTTPRGPVFEKDNSLNGTIQQWKKKYPYRLLLIAFVILIMIIWIASPQNKSDLKIIKIDKTSENENYTSTSSKTPEDVIIAHINKGDSYTIAVRRTITEYLKNKPDIKSTPGRRLYAETIITKEVQNQRLTEGGELSIPENSVRSSLTEKFDLLTQYQKNTWEYNARSVIF